MNTTLTYPTRAETVDREMTRDELEAREFLIEGGKRAFVQVGTALAEIRDRRGYRFDFKTFEDYCRVRWDFTRQAAQQYIDSAIVVKELPAEMSTRVDISHARELARLAAPSSNGDKRKKQIDAEAVREVASTIDFGKATVKQVAAKVDEHIRAQKKGRRADELAAKAQALKPGTAKLSDKISYTVLLFNRDSRTLSKFVNPDVDLVFTSPPYNVGVDYNTHFDHMPEEEYFRFLRTVFRECCKVMREGARIGVVVPFGVGRNPWKPLAPRVQETLEAAGFTLMGQVSWDKGWKVAASRTSWGSYNSPTAPRFRDRTEAILWAYKDKDRLSIPKGSELIEPELFQELSQDVWEATPGVHSHHPAVFPELLVEYAIRFFGYRNCHVLDPFAGIGTVGRVARRLGCRASLVELDRAYCAIAQADTDALFVDGGTK